MTITTRQLGHLKEMGITLWHRKTLVSKNQVSQTMTDEETQVNNIITEISASEVGSKQIFQDILCALSIQTTDISWQKSHIDLGLFNWQFVEDTKIYYEKCTLTTPSIHKISQSNVIKRQLWQTIIKHNLIS
jgi:DNA polymerase III psi subunit